MTRYDGHTARIADAIEQANQILVSARGAATVTLDLDDITVDINRNGTSLWPYSGYDKFTERSFVAAHNTPADDDTPGIVVHLNPHPDERDELLDNLRGEATAARAAHPQYAGRYDGDDWQLVRFARRWWSKGEHSVFEPGDVVLARRVSDAAGDPDDAEWLAYCSRSQSDCAIEVGYATAV